jgi:hypothetical protein
MDWEKGDPNPRPEPGTVLRVRVTPRAGRNSVERVADGTYRIRVTAVPEDGKATEAARRLLAGALGIAPTRLTLISGLASRDKAFRVGE